MSDLDSVKLKPQPKHQNLQNKWNLQHECCVCKKYCKKESYLKIHMRCHDKKWSNLRCRMCHLRYKNKYILSSHFHQVHSRQKLKDIQNNISIVSYCTCCGQKFGSLLDLKRHLMSTLSQFPSLFGWLQEKKQPNVSRSQAFESVPSSCLSDLSVDSTTVPNRTFTFDSKNRNLLLNPKSQDNDSKGGNHLSSSIAPVSIFKNNIDCRQCDHVYSKEKSMSCLKFKSAQKSISNGQEPKISIISQNNSSKKQCNSEFLRIKFLKRNEIMHGEKNNTYACERHNLLPSTVLEGEAENSLNDGEFISLIHTVLDDDSSSDDVADSRVNNSINTDFDKDAQSFFVKSRKDLVKSREILSEKDVTDSKESDLMQHFLQTQTLVDIPSKLFKCLHCKNTFSTDVKLLDHLRFHICLICGTLFERIHRLSQHRDEHSSGDNEMFDSAFTLNMFEKYTHTSDDGNIFTCYLCPRQFSQRSNLFVHMYSHAKNPPDKTQESDLSESSMGVRKRLFSCPQCKKRFYSKRNLAGHMETHDETYKYLCSFCGKGFRRKRSMHRHCEAHTKGNKEMEFKTNINKKKGDTKVVYKNTKPAAYRKQIKSNSGQFVVTACFTPQKLLPDLTPVMDLRERTFACTECDKKFFNRHNLRGHMEVHRPMKFSCSVCNRGFRKSSTLKRHVATHEKNL